MTEGAPAYAAGIVGLGGYVPETVITNEMLSARLDTSDAWIRSRTGIAERRFADDAQSTSDLAIKAGVRAMRSAHDLPIEAVVVATTTPDYRCPATAPRVASQLGLGQIPAFDISAVCAGFVYAMSVATAFVRSGQYESVLVIAAEKFSALIDAEDRTTACLFGDGAAAVVVARVAPGSPGEIVSITLQSDGRLEDLIKIQAGGSKYPIRPEKALALERSDIFLSMRGQDVFTAAVTFMVSSVTRLLQEIGWDRHDIDWLVGHQANKRILDMVCKALELPPEKTCLHLDEVGNTAGASIPLALTAKSGQFKTGDRMVLTSFGAGAAWGSLAMTWPNIPVVSLDQ